jgi:hypothetical protein
MAVIDKMPGYCQTGAGGEYSIFWTGYEAGYAPVSLAFVNSPDCGPEKFPT